MKHIYKISLAHYTSEGFSFSEDIDTVEMDGDLTVKDYLDSLDTPDSLCPTAEGAWGWLTISKYSPTAEMFLPTDDDIFYDTTRLGRIRVNFCGGEGSELGQAVDCMIAEFENPAGEKVELRAEAIVEDEDCEWDGDYCVGESYEAEIRHYEELKAEIIKQARALRIDPVQFEFQ